MRRRFSLCALGFVVWLVVIGTAVIGSAPPAGAATLPPSLVSPATSSANTNLVTVTFVLPEAPLAGSVTLSFVGGVSCSLTLSTSSAGTTTFTLNTTNVIIGPPVNSTTCPANAIAFGTYNVTLSYQNSAGDPAATAATATGVVIAAPITLAPSMTSPVASTTYTPVLPVAYVLGEAPLSGSVRLVFAGSTTCTLTMGNATSVSFALSTISLLADPAVQASTCGGSLPQGTYDVTLAYQDAGSAPAASVTAAVVVIGPAPPTTTTSATTTSGVPTTTGVPTTSTARPSPTLLGQPGAPTGPASQPSARLTDTSLADTSLAATGTGRTMPLALAAVGTAGLGIALMLLARRLAF